MMWCWLILLWFLPFLKAQESEMVIYAQVGGTVTLPRQKTASENVYVNWFRGSESERILSRNPQGGVQKGKEMKTHASLSADFSLKISPVQESDFGLWRCEQHVLTVTYTQLYRLYRVTIPVVPPVMVGGSVSLRCNAESSSVNPTIYWISPENSGCSEKTYYTAGVSLKDVTRCHSGVWKCKLQYGKRETEAKTTVSVIDLSKADPVYTSVSSSTVNIPCSLSSQIPWSVLNHTGLQGGSWSFTSLSDQQPISLMSLSIGPVVRWEATPQGKNARITGRELKNQDLSLLNLPVSEKIRGVYTCSLNFKSKTLSREIKVEVLNVSSSGGAKLHEGQRVNLTCTLGHQNTPDLEVKWKHSSSSHPHLRSSPHPSVLSIPEVRMEDKGRWTCELWKKDINETILTSSSIFLNIEKAPVNIWLYVGISGVLVFVIALIVIVVKYITKHRQMMYRRRKATKFCCCKNQQKGFYRT